MKSEFEDIKLLGTWVHGPGLFHGNFQIKHPDDLKGKKVRGGSRIVTGILKDLDAIPVGMPALKVAHYLVGEKLDGAALPWHQARDLEVSNVSAHQTQFFGNGLYSLTYALIMNKDKFEELPDDIKKVIDANSGLTLSIDAGRIMEEYDARYKQEAKENGNIINTISYKDVSEIWRPKVKPIYDRWYAQMNKSGKDGRHIVNSVRAEMWSYCRNPN